MRALRITPVLFLLWAALFCACSRQKSAFTEKNAPRHFNELRAVEALLETDPVKAMDSINGLAASSSESAFTPLDSVEMQLRIVQAQYNNRCLTEQSLDLSPIVVFYDSLATLYPEDGDLQYLRANAYYYKGVQCTFANEDVDAFKH